MKKNIFLIFLIFFFVGCVLDPYKNEKYAKLVIDNWFNYQNGDDVVIAVKNNTLSIRRLYRYPKGIILQALNPKYPTINVNVVANNMILGCVTSIYREMK